MVSSGSAPQHDWHYMIYLLRRETASNVRDSRARFQSMNSGVSSDPGTSGRSIMRTRLLAIAIGSAGFVAFAAAQQFQPLNVKTGLWQMTKKIAWTGLPPQMAGMMKKAPQTTQYNSCVTKEGLRSNPWANGSGDNCTWTVVSSTSTDMEVTGTGCQLGANNGMTAQVHGQIHIVDSTDGTGSMTVTLTGNGQTATGQASYTGKWISASCPAQ
jgi:hypothetical protein